MLLAAFILGFLGSFHCVAMCGPLTIALISAASPSSESNRGAVLLFLLRKSLYNVSRAATYTALGLTLGLSKNLMGAMMFDVHGAQEALSLMLGCTILLVVAVPARYKSRLSATPLIARPLFALRRTLSKTVRAQSLAGHALLGMLNGLLPCGFVYMALAFAALSGSIWEAGISMFLFGVGTLPAMIGIALLAQFSGQGIAHVGVSMRRFAPFGAVFIALLFILRGLALDIPYLSPKLQPAPAGIEQGCHVPKQ